MRGTKSRPRVDTKQMIQFFGLAFLLLMRIPMEEWSVYGSAMLLGSEVFPCMKQLLLC